MGSNQMNTSERWIEFFNYNTPKLDDKRRSP